MNQLYNFKLDFENSSCLKRCILIHLIFFLTAIENEEIKICLFYFFKSGPV